MVRQKSDDGQKPIPPPAKTLEGREDQLVAAAYDLAEERIADRSASASEVVHFLKIGSVQAKLQNEKLRGENEVLMSRVREMENKASQEDLYAAAIKAFKGYSGQESVDVEEYYDA